MLCFTLLLFLASTNALPTISGSSMIVHESVSQVPEGFLSNGPAPATQLLHFGIGLHQGSMPDLEKALYEVSTPSSPLYGQHLDKQTMETFVRPFPDTIEAVTTWLSSNDIITTSSSPAGDWIYISIPASKANEIFDTTFNVFTHQKSGQTTVRTLSYSIPSALKEHMDLVHPTVNFPDFGFDGPLISSPSSQSSNTGGPACGQSIRPICIEQLYNIPTTNANQSTNKIAVTGLLGQYPNSADLKDFIQETRPDLSDNTNFILQTIDGGQDPQSQNSAGMEANLDVQYTVGLASGVAVDFVSVGPRNGDQLNGFLDLANFLLNETEIPQVLTTSYNAGENFYTRPLSQRICNAYMQLGARGTSVLFSSGDGGVSGTRVINDCASFVPTFPSGCPYITVVGSTGGIPERASSFSSGGFSDYYGVPEYQQEDVSSYLSGLGSNLAGLFNSTGRGYPDISAQGENIEIIYEGQPLAVEGTSSSAPIVASIISLINDRLIAAGKSPLGFLNPFLYSEARNAFNDITNGTQAGCVSGGFPVKSGWDPVTGLGTPDFNKLLAAAGL